MNKNEWLFNTIAQGVSDERMARFTERLQDRTRHVAVVLENIYQPHNAAAVLRSCDAFGIQDVHIIENKNKFKPSAEVDMGASKWLNLIHYPTREKNTERSLTAIRDSGYSIVATSPLATQTIEELKVDKPLAILFGTELTGLTDTALKMADQKIRIPMYGFSESLNISVSAAISLYALSQRIRVLDPSVWKLSPEHQQEILFQWIINSTETSEKMMNELIRRYEALDQKS